MKNRKFNPFHTILIFLFSLVIISSVTAKEKVIKQEKMSYEQCLTVISTSETKLSISPKITSETDQMRVAIFTLLDGTLTITCDGIDGIVKVTTSTN